jgi:hypothetical protein
MLWAVPTDWFLARKRVMTKSHEDNFREVVDARTVPTRFLAGSGIELIDGFAIPRPPRHVLFDFDGTLSLIREGWPEIMIPMMVELLEATGTGNPGNRFRGPAGNS